MKLTAAFDEAWRDELNPPPHILVLVAEFVACRKATWRRSFGTPIHTGQSGGDAQGETNLLGLFISYLLKRLLFFTIQVPGDLSFPGAPVAYSCFARTRQQQHASFWEREGPFPAKVHAGIDRGYWGTAPDI